jgi:hypothetical protein
MENYPSILSNIIPQRNRLQFAEPKEPNIFFNSCFDSGNMHKVVRNAYDHYSIWTACDAQGTDNEGYPKSWFYFETGGFESRKVTFSVHRVHFLCALVPISSIRQRNIICIGLSIASPVTMVNEDSGRDWTIQF